MELEELEKYRELMGSNVRVILNTDNIIEGYWKTNQVNTQSGISRMVLKSDNSTVAIPLNIIKNIKKNESI